MLVVERGNRIVGQFRRHAAQTDLLQGGGILLIGLDCDLGFSGRLQLHVLRVGGVNLGGPGLDRHGLSGEIGQGSDVLGIALGHHDALPSQEVGHEVHLSWNEQRR